MSQCKAKHQPAGKSGPIYYCVLEAGHERFHKDSHDRLFAAAMEDVKADLFGKRHAVFSVKDR